MTTKNSAPTLPQCVAFGCAVTALLSAGLMFLLSTPVVQVSAVSGRCIQVIHPAPGESCHNLPKRYRTVKVR
jgi:hypothetical protein